MTSTTTPENVRIQALSVPATALFTTAEVARLLSLSEAALKTMRSRGLGPKFFKIGKRGIRYRHIDLEVWIATHRIETMRCAAAANKPASRANTFASRAQR